MILMGPLISWVEPGQTLKILIANAMPTITYDLVKKDFMIAPPFGYGLLNRERTHSKLY